MKDRITNGGVGADIAQLADALYAGRIDVVILLGQHDHFDARDVRVHG
jgi:hypothetical protein